MVLRKGSRARGHISELQDALNQYIPKMDDIDELLITDGIYGKATVEAVMEFQELAGLDIDGIAGSKTLEALAIAWHSVGTTVNIEDEPLHDSGKALADIDPMVIIASILPMFDEEAHDGIIEHWGSALEALGPEGMAKVELNTPLDFSVMFGQMREEVGYHVSTTEDFRYYKPKTLKKVFRNFRVQPELADKYGYIKSKGQIGNSKMIAGIAYEGRANLGNTQKGDGLRFIGAGYKQLTGRSNYQGYHDWLKTTLPDVYAKYHGAEIMELGAELVSQPPHAVLSAIYFWHKHKVYTAVQYGFTKKASDTATKIINRNTDSYGKRWAHMSKVGKLLGIV